MYIKHSTGKEFLVITRNSWDNFHNPYSVTNVEFKYTSIIGKMAKYRSIATI